jgi:MFS superfamily sulfate permease-like transporter
MTPATHTTPLDGIGGLKQNWQSDIVSGFIIFLIALPLSLGIAIASGMPPMAGIIAAVIGGVVVSQCNGSFVTINGPAAGLIVVIVTAIDKLGGGMQGYHATLAAIVISGVILFVLGLLKAGELGKAFPASVVHGMLASIGMIIMLKQFPVMMGVAPPAKEPLMLLQKIPYTIAHANPELAFIGILSLLLLIAVSTVKRGIFRKIPAPLMVVALACSLGMFFNVTVAHSYSAFGQTFDISPTRCLVQVPSNIASAFTAPDFSAIYRNGFWMAVMSITLVQGIETILSCASVDKLDPFRRHANLSRDLSAVGLGSAISGMLGGLPMIAEIVRSTANISNGGKTRWSNFFHGMFILVFVLFASKFINSIPLSALAALLVFTGYRLASPKVFIEIKALGWEQLFLFVTTIIVTLSSDLLIGAAAGIAIKCVLHTIRGVSIKQFLKADVQIEDLDKDLVMVKIKKVAVFSNYLSIKKQLEKIPASKKLVLDVSQATFIDHTVMEHLHELEQNKNNEYASVSFVGLDQLKATTNLPTASRKHIVVH